MRFLTAIALSALLLTAAMSMTSASEIESESTLISCEVTELGPAGPRGNELDLRILDSEIRGIGIRQTGGRIEAGWFDDYELEWDRPNISLQPVECSGTQPTVRNIDRIDIELLPSPGMSVYLDGSKSGKHLFLAPGATPEAGSSDEIEIRVHGQRRDFRTVPVLLVHTGARSDVIAVGSVRERIALNLNHGLDGDRPDIDLLPGIQVGSVEIWSGAGGDQVTGMGDGAVPRLDSWTDLYLRGGGGSDRLTGHEGRDRINGDGGRDLIRGLTGDDRRGWDDTGLSGGPGRDRVFGGPGDDTIGGLDGDAVDSGRDLLFGGPGDETFLGHRDGARDVIDCGPGDVGRLDYDPRLDLLENCRR